jgi:predicted nucleotidyltransferase
MDILERNINNLKKLCVKHNVSELYAFGSVLTNKFQDESDIDLLISFKKIDINDYLDN